MSGCAICVHDLYQESIEAYDSSVSTLRASLNALNIPEQTWPAQIQNGSVKSERKKDPSLSAFEQMELQLAAKRNETSSSSGSVIRDGRTFPSLLLHQIPFLMSKTASLENEKRARNAQSQFSTGALAEAVSWVVFSRR